MDLVLAEDVTQSEDLQRVRALSPITLEDLVMSCNIIQLLLVRC